MAVPTMGNLQYPVPLAIVGMSCRFPAGANDPSLLWSMLSEGHSAWSTVPAERFNEKAFHHPSPDVNGSTNHRGGHFLDQNIRAFDADFFGISPAEANAVDPQQRIQLESAYEALENAGIRLESVRGTNTAVYTAIFSRDYDRMMYKDTSDMAKYHMTGVGDAILSNRISYAFDLKGTSMTLDTGCSGSMVALHQACQGLRSGESDMALVGGANLILSPDAMIPMSLLHVLNGDGKCYAFDSRGSGYGRGEGVATIVLKRLDDALKSGDSIRAIVRNTGVNQDGKTPGIAVPSSEAQQKLMSSLYLSTGIDPNKVCYVEAHGTGTEVGDAAELESISQVFCGRNDREFPLYVGSVKSNIGHLESCSGLASVIKAVLSLENCCIPPNADFRDAKKNMSGRLSKKIQIPRNKVRWPDSQCSGPRYASVNNFGYGGTNAHCILQALDASGSQNDYTNMLNGDSSFRPEKTGLSNDNDQVSQTNVKTPKLHVKFPNGEEAKVHVERKQQPKYQNVNGTYTINKEQSISVPSNLTRLFVITARSKNSLSGTSQSLARWLSNHQLNDEALADLAYTLCSRRSHMAWRRSILASNSHELEEALYQDSNPVKSVDSHSKTLFIFTGQGAQHFAMGRELLRTKSKFTDSLLLSEKILKDLGASWSIIDELQLEENASHVNESRLAQPCVTALQIALVNLLESLGVRPHAVIGHSSGEIAAAYAAGALSQAAALKVAFYRGYISEIFRRTSDSKGAMIAVGLGEDEASNACLTVENGEVNVACVNSPSSTTLSGDELAISQLQKSFDDSGVFNRRLKVDIAYHSHHMRKPAVKYLGYLEGLEHGIPNPSVNFISSVTGEWKQGNFGPSYWVDNLVSRVSFSAALGTYCKMHECTPQVTSSTPVHDFIEIGPHSALSTPILQTVLHVQPKGFKSAYQASLIRHRDAVRTMLDVVGRLFAAGKPVDLVAANALDGSSQRRSNLHNLPPYVWDHSSVYWHESRLSVQHRMRREPHHDLLGLRIIGYASPDQRWRNLISVDALPWLRDHVVDNFVTFPGSAYLCMALEALKQTMRDDRMPVQPHQFVFRDVEFLKALIIPDVPNTTIEVNLILTPSESGNRRNSTGWEEFRVSSWSDKTGWSHNCQGLVMAEYPNPADGIEAFQEQDFQMLSQKQEFRSMKSASKDSMNARKLYEDLEASGNKYGRYFALLEEVWVGEMQAVGRVNIPDVAECMPSKFMQPHTIHPTTLDALLHTTFPLFTRHNAAGSILVVGIKELTIAANIPSEPNHSFLVGASVSPNCARSTPAYVLAFERDRDSDLRPVVSLSGELRAIGEAQSASQETQADISTVYAMNWEPDVDFVTKDYFLTTPDIKLPGSKERSFEETSDTFRKAAYVYIQNCLSEIADRKHDVLASHMAFLYEWMQKIATSEGYRKVINDPKSVEMSLHDLKTLGIEGEVLSQVGSQITSILIGKLDPLACLLENGLLHRLYSDDSSMRCCAHLIEYVKLATFKNPQMKVLEIGAGTGGTTLPVLRALTTAGSLPIKHYDYTDISPGFFGNVQEKLKEWSESITFRTLNIEEDPTGQGFVEASYDLVIASNVLHATKHIEESIGHVRKLLKPGGRLAMIEMVRSESFTNLIFGTLPGWWRGRGEGRLDSPLLSASRWNDVLTRKCFSGVQIAAKDIDGRAHRSSMMISTALIRNSDQLMELNIVREEGLSDSDETLFQAMGSSLTDLGCRVSTSHWESPQPDGPVYLIADSGTKPFLADASHERFQQLRALLTRVSRIFWVTFPGNGPDRISGEGGVVTGLARVARSENESLQIVTFDIQANIDQATTIEAIGDVFTRSFLSVVDNPCFGETEYVYKDGQVLIPRLIPQYDIGSMIEIGTQSSKTGLELFHQPDRPLKLHIESPGLLDSLVFNDDTEIRTPLAHDELEIHVEACGINFKDVFIALGRMRPTDRMAGECAGYVVSVGSSLHTLFKVGNRVCAWNATPYASRARVSGTDAYSLPDSIAYTTGASIPVVFLTAYYSLMETANLQKGQSILIHAASGGVGQAALMIAQYVGAEVFVTVGSASKRDLIATKYQVPVTHIFSSRALNFKRGIMRLTQGKGVDVILNSSSGEVLQETWECIATFGIFVEIGKSDIYRKGHISMEPFDRHVSFVSVDLTKIARYKPEISRSLLAKIMRMFENGSLQSVEPVSVMPVADIEGAFRKIQARNHVGKLVLEAGEGMTVRATWPQPKPLRLDPDGTYVVAGGLGSLGRHICHFIASRGAGNIVVLSRKPLSPGAQSFLQHEVEPLGTRVMVLQCDITDRLQVSNASSRCHETMPRVKGLFNCAMVLHDCILEHMDRKTFEDAVKPKILGTRNLNDTFCSSELEFFIMLSSVSGILGFRSQGNYAAGNTFQDWFAQSHTQPGTRYISLNLGMVDGSEAISSRPERIKSVQREGGLLLTLHQILAFVEYSMSSPVHRNHRKQLVIGFDRSSLSRERENTLRRPMFSHLTRSDIRGSIGNAVAKEETPAEAVIASGSLQEVHQAIVNALVKQIATIMAMDEEKISLDAPTAEFGLDSLIAVELKNWVLRTFHAGLQTSEILDESSVHDLARMVAQRSKLVSEHLRGGDQENQLLQRDFLVNPIEGKQDVRLPLFPLPDLMDTTALYHESVCALISQEEAQQTKKAIYEFLASDGLGQRLQSRLKARKDDPRLDSWLSDLYNTHVYLNNRAPVNPFQHFYGTHSASAVQHSQAERATIVAMAAIKFKTIIENDQLAPDLMNDQPLCMHSRYWIFNSSREPHPNVDEMRRFPGHDYMIVMRQGHYFKVAFRNGSQDPNHDSLLTMFQAILDRSLPKVASIATLTAENRNTWAQVREEVKALSQENRDLIEMLDRAAFIVCLDTVSPTTASERCHQFLYSDPSSRWSDKTLQFIVCPNGVSAYVCEHAYIDGGILKQLNQLIKQAILDHDNHLQIKGNAQINGQLDLEALSFCSNDQIDRHVDNAQQLFCRNKIDSDYHFYRCCVFGGSFLRSRRCAPKSGFQIVIQLAALKYFGHQNPSWETVSMRPFHKGRVDIYQAILPSIKTFCAAINTRLGSRSYASLRPLFDDAVKAHTNLLARVSRGGGFAGHMYALQEVIEPGEPVPALFSDPIYARTRPAKLMTDCAQWLDAIQEGGFAMPDPEHVWVHYEIDDSGCDFAIRGPAGRVVDFIAALKVAIRQVKELLDST